MVGCAVAKPRRRSGQARRPVAFVRDAHRADVAAHQTLLNLSFLELDMLAHDGIIFAHHHFLGGIRTARIFFRGVVKARIGRADELDFDGGRLCHDLKLSNLTRSRCQ